MIDVVNIKQKNDTASRGMVKKDGATLWRIGEDRYWTVETMPIVLDEDQQWPYESDKDK